MRNETRIYAKQHQRRLIGSCNGGGGGGGGGGGVCVCVSVCVCVGGVYYFCHQTQSFMRNEGKCDMHTSSMEAPSPITR